RHCHMIYVMNLHQFLYLLFLLSLFSLFFFFNVPATTEIYTLSLHDALPILYMGGLTLTNLGKSLQKWGECIPAVRNNDANSAQRDRKSTRLNSSHDQISYAVFCLKKKKNTTKERNAAK